MAVPIHPAWNRIERDVQHHNSAPSIHRPGEHEIELSKAISLKRIADALAPSDAPRSLLLSLIEQIAENHR